MSDFCNDKSSAITCEGVGRNANELDPKDRKELERIAEHQKNLAKQADELVKQMKAAGKGIIGMKILGAGKLRHKPDECLQFVLAQNVVDCFTIGSESREELLDLTRKIPAASVRG